MKLLHNYGSLSIQTVEGKGRGVIAERGYRVGEAITVQPVLVLSAEDTALLERTLLSNYFFQWPYTAEGKPDPDSMCGAIGLGITSLFNTSSEPNAAWRFNPRRQMQTIYATRRIRSGEEICINYNWPDGLLAGTSK